MVANPSLRIVVPGETAAESAERDAAYREARVQQAIERIRSVPGWDQPDPDEERRGRPPKEVA